MVPHPPSGRPIYFADGLYPASGYIGKLSPAKPRDIAREAAVEEVASWFLQSPDDLRRELGEPVVIGGQDIINRQRLAR